MLELREMNLGPALNFGERGDVGEESEQDDGEGGGKGKTRTIRVLLLIRKKKPIGPLKFQFSRNLLPAWGRHGITIPHQSRSASSSLAYPGCKLILSNVSILRTMSAVEQPTQNG